MTTCSACAIPINWLASSDHDQIVMANLIVSTTHNNEPMNRAVTRVAKDYISGKPVFLHNSTFPHAGVVTCAHCSAPRRLDGRV